MTQYKDDGLRRREFVKVCAGVAAAVSARPEALLATSAARQQYNRVKLMRSAAQPLTPEDVEQSISYVFTYPFSETPCFLINLGRKIKSTEGLTTAIGESYQSIDGLGEESSIVAFSAICTHKLSHPAKAISFIDYRAESTSYVDHELDSQTQSNIIFCCSERSAYDPAQGGRVLGGPAVEPLTNIIVELDESDGAIYATGTIGGNVFDRFFEKFGPRLSLEYGSDEYLKPIEGEAVVTTLDEYSAARKTC